MPKPPKPVPEQQPGEENLPPTSAAPQRTIDASRVAAKLTARLANAENLNAQYEVLIEDLQAENEELKKKLSGVVVPDGD